MKTINHIFDDSIIRSYDIRGIFNKTLFEKDAKVIGQLFGLEVGKNKKINVGYDGRKSSEPLKDSLIEGILESGADVCEIGLVPTPLLYFSSTSNNSSQDYSFFQTGAGHNGITSAIFTGITTVKSDGSLGTIVQNTSDVNSNQLPRGGIVVSVASTGGMGVAPLQGAIIRPLIGAGKSISGFIGIPTTGASLAISTASYDNVSGEMQITTETDHNFRYPNEFVRLRDLEFTCSGYSGAGTTTIFPDTINDKPFSIISIESRHQFTANVGVSTIPHTFLGSFGPLGRTGIASAYYADLNVGSGYFASGIGVTVSVEDLEFEHRFVSSGINSITANSGGPFTATNAEYVSSTGVLTLTIPNHGLTVSNTLGITTGGLVFTCSRDNFTTVHPYPRPTDPAAGVALTITSVSTNQLTVNVGPGGGSGTGANVTAAVGAGGTLTFDVTNGGSGYVNPVITVSPPSYENLPVVGVSRLGVGATTELGNGTLVSVEVGSGTSVGIGTTLVSVKSFKIVNPGFGYKVGDVFKPVGLVTSSQLSQLVSDLEFTVTETFTDKFSSWDFGEFDYIDPIGNLQDGVKTRFPLRVNGELLSFDVGQTVDSQQIDMNALLIIYVNNVLQDPGVAYSFEGGTTFEFTTAPEANDDIAVFFYKGTASEDVAEVNVVETIKNGDVVKLQANDDTSILTNQNTRRLIDLAQRKRTVSGITTTDTLETEIYTGVGINDSATNKPLTWIKQKEDKVVNGVVVSKSRDSIEPLIYPTARIIGDIGAGSTSKIYVDDANFFQYEANEDSAVNDINFDALIINDNNPVSASFTATVSTAGTISAIAVADGGSGYVGNSTSVHISQPPVPMKVSPIATGIGSTAVATANITNGTITSVTINSGGIGYSTSITPKVIAFAQKPVTELIESIDTSSADFAGFSGIVTGISTVMIGSTMGLKFGLSRAGAFTNLKATMPIYISDTSVGHGVTSLNESGIDGNVVAIGRTFVDNVYMIKNITRHSNAAEIEVNVHSGINTNGIDLAKTNLPFTVTFGSVGSGNTSYIASGKHRGEFSTQPTLSSAHNPTIYVEKGDILSIANSTGGHTFTIKRTLGGSNYTTGVTGSGANGSTLVFNTAQIGTGSTSFFYQCASHPNAMYGQIVVKEIEKGKFSFGVLTPASGNFVRNNPVAIGVTGNTVIAGEGLGISTFPTIQRRGFGIRDGGGIKRSHTP